MNNRYIQWKTNNPASYEEVLRRRRERYAESNAYRSRQLSHTADWRSKQKTAKKKKKKPPRKRTPKPKMFRVDDIQVECWSAGRTAEFLDVDKKTITNLEHAGTIPTNHLVTANGRRWWPAEFVAWLRQFFEERKLGIPAQEFHRRVWIGWSEEQVRGIIPVVSCDSRRKDSGDDGKTQIQSVAS